MLPLYHFLPSIPLPSGLCCSFWESVVKLIVVPLYMMNHFFLAVFRFFSCSLAFNNLTIMFLDVDLFCLSYLRFVELFGYVIYVFWHILEVCDHYFFKYFFSPFSFCFPSGTPIIHMLVYMKFPLRSLRLCSYFFNLFSPFFLTLGKLNWSIFKLADTFFCYSNLLLSPSNKFFISFTISFQL